jgi:parvulin-like peptidyl-prolyl isomerase
MEPMAEGDRARWLLALGAAAGLLAAATSLLGAPDAGLPGGAVAAVNGTPIRAEEYERLLAALAADRRTPLDAEDRRFVLDRMIEEELLVQHAVALGLVRSDRRVRADLVSAVLAATNAAADAYDPEPQEVARFYAENADYFTRPERLHVRQIFVAAGADSARERARRAATRLRAGEPFAQVAEELGDELLAPLPDAPLPPTKLREYLGPSALRAALALAPAEVSDPVETPQGYHVLELVARTRSEAPPLAEVEAQVRSEMRRREGDRLLRRRLDDLRAEADVVVSEDLPAEPEAADSTEERGRPQAAASAGRWTEASAAVAPELP